MLRLVPNDPLDIEAMAALLVDRDELFLVWPEARFPFDGEQWREKLLSRPGNRSYLLVLDRDTIGHAALMETEEPQTLAVSYLFIRPDQRGRGLGRALMAQLETEARTLGARAVRLRVRTYNPRAAHIYASSGYIASERDGTLVIMHKSLGP